MKSKYEMSTRASRRVDIAAVPVAILLLSASGLGRLFSIGARGIDEGVEELELIRGRRGVGGEDKV